MPLAPGTRLTTYQILAPLGVGGRGEVYRAIDTKLWFFLPNYDVTADGPQFLLIKGSEFEGLERRAGPGKN